MHMVSEAILASNVSALNIPYRFDPSYPAKITKSTSMLVAQTENAGDLLCRGLWLRLSNKNILASGADPLFSRTIGQDESIYSH